MRSTPTESTPLAPTKPAVPTPRLTLAELTPPELNCAADHLDTASRAVYEARRALGAPGAATSIATWRGYICAAIEALVAASRAVLH